MPVDRGGAVCVHAGSCVHAGGQEDAMQSELGAMRGKFKDLKTRSLIPIRVRVRVRGHSSQSGSW